MLAVTTIIGKYTWIGLCSNVINNVTIAEKCMIRAGSCVISDIYYRWIYIGIPAKSLDF